MERQMIVTRNSSWMPCTAAWRYLSTGWGVTPWGDAALLLTLRSSHFSLSLAICIPSYWSIYRSGKMPGVSPTKYWINPKSLISWVQKNYIVKKKKRFKHISFDNVNVFEHYFILGLCLQKSTVYWGFFCPFLPFFPEAQSLSWISCQVSWHKLHIVLVFILHCTVYRPSPLPW